MYSIRQRKSFVSLGRGREAAGRCVRTLYSKLRLFNLLTRRVLRCRCLCGGGVDLSECQSAYSANPVSLRMLRQIPHATVNLATQQRQKGRGQGTELKGCWRREVVRCSMLRMGGRRAGQDCTLPGRGGVVVQIAIVDIALDPARYPRVGAGAGAGDSSCVRVLLWETIEPSARESCRRDGRAAGAAEKLEIHSNIVTMERPGEPT